MQGMTLDELVVIISAQTSDFKKEVAQINSQLDGLGKQATKQTSGMSDAFSRVGNVGVRVLQVGIVAAIGAIAASIPGAVKRIDTLVAFPRVLVAMGATAEQAKASTDKLSESLRGLPTPLQEGAAGVQALVSAGLDVKGATDVFLAFNDATLAASTEAGAAQGAFTQLVQSISKGKIEGQEWNSIVSAMPTAFQALAKESGLSRAELQELYRTDPQKLLDDLVRLDKEGGGGLASLETQARAATGGIGTGFANMQTSIVRGLEGIVKKLGDGSLEAGQRKISDALSAIGGAFAVALEKVGDLVSFVVQHGQIFGPLAAGIGIVIGLITAWTIAQGILNAVMAVNPIALLIIAIAGLVTGLVVFFTQTELGKEIWSGFVKFMGEVWDNLTKGVTAVATFFSEAWDNIQLAIMMVIRWISNNWPLLIAILTGPIGIVVGLIVANWETIKNAFVSAWNYIKSVWSGVTGYFGGVWNGIVSAFSNVVGWFGSMFSEAWNKVKNINWLQLGTDIVAGIANGLNPAKIVDRMKNIASSAMDAVKKFLGIHSPSKRMRDEVGKMMGAGLADGIDASTSDAMKSAAKSASRVYGAFNGSSLNSLPSASQLSSSLELSLPSNSMSISGRLTPIVLQLENGDVLGNYMIDAVNNRAFMSNSSILNV